jgi:predicted 2-oxoglutarate/Fe(II)-dependent dioxygenase YbiX
LYCPEHLREDNILREAEFYQITFPKPQNAQKPVKFIYFRASSTFDFSKDGNNLQIHTFSYEWLPNALLKTTFVKQEENGQEVRYYIIDLGELVTFMNSHGLKLVSHKGKK